MKIINRKSSELGVISSGLVRKPKCMPTCGTHFSLKGCCGGFLYLQLFIFWGLGA